MITIWVPKRLVEIDLYNVAAQSPAALAEMVRAAETLAADFPYARIDLFYCGGKVYFGEITFYHGGAFERFDPPEFDRIFGEKLALPR